MFSKFVTGFMLLIFLSHVQVGSALPLLDVSDTAVPPGAISSQFAVGIRPPGTGGADPINDLYAFQFDLSFDPAVIAVTSITEGSLLVRGGLTFFLPGAIDNLFGRVMFTANTLLGAVTGVDGFGTLALFDFDVIDPLMSSSSSITLSNVLLFDSLGRSIPVDIGDGLVSVDEPGTDLLLLFGLVLLVNASRRPNSLNDLRPQRFSRQQAAMHRASIPCH